MKRILSLIIAVLGLTMVVTATPYAYKNAAIVWHGNANRIGESAAGWWPSAIVWGQQSSWNYYSPPVDATVELLTVNGITRSWWGMSGTPLGYTYQAGSSSTSVSRNSSSTTCFVLGEEIYETWFGGDATYRYNYTKREWIMRVTLSAPWIASPAAPQPGNPGGAASFEVVVWSAWNAFILGTIPVTFPAGATTIDVAIDHGNYAAWVLNWWTGSPNFPLTAYFTGNYTPQYPAWTGIAVPYSVTPEEAEEYLVEEPVGSVDEGL